MKQRILIIDDEQSVRDAFELALSPLGYDIETAPDGLAGIAAAERASPDLIFLDLKMPGIDGVETLTRLKAVNPAFKVYIVTAFSREYMTSLETARNDGLTFQLAAKPLSAEQIRLVASAALGAGEEVSQ